MDKKRRAKGVPPQDYAKWLKSGERRLVKGVSVTKLGVTKTMIAITYIPKNRTERYYNHNLGGDYDLFGLIVSIANLKAPKISNTLPKNLAILINIVYLMSKIVKYSDNRAFKKEMDKGNGVAIVEVRIWSAAAGGSVAITYHSWNGKGDLYEFI